jgi:hypothetical protein
MSIACDRIHQAGEVGLSAFVGTSDDFSQQGGDKCAICPGDELFHQAPIRDGTGAYVCDGAPEAVVNSVSGYSVVQNCPSHQLCAGTVHGCLSGPHTPYDFTESCRPTVDCSWAADPEGSTDGSAFSETPMVPQNCPAGCVFDDYGPDDEPACFSAADCTFTPGSAASCGAGCAYTAPENLVLNVFQGYDGANAHAGGGQVTILLDQPVLSDDDGSIFGESGLIKSQITAAIVGMEPEVTLEDGQASICTNQNGHRGYVIEIDATSGPNAKEIFGGAAAVYSPGSVSVDSCKVLATDAASCQARCIETAAVSDPTDKANCAAVTGAALDDETACLAVKLSVVNAGVACTFIPGPNDFCGKKFRSCSALTRAFKRSINQCKERVS